MNRTKMILLSAMLSVAAACSPTAGRAQQPAPAGSLIVTGLGHSGTGPAHSLVLSAAMLRSMPQTTLRVLNNHEHVSQTYSGVPLILLLRKVGAPEAAGVRGKALAEYIVAVGQDHYKAVLSLAEIEPAFHPGTILVADRLDGKPLGIGQGPLKLVVSEDRQPARWVRDLVRVELREAR